MKTAVKMFSNLEKGSIVTPHFEAKIIGARTRNWRNAITFLSGTKLNSAISRT